MMRLVLCLTLLGLSHVSASADKLPPMRPFDASSMEAIRAAHAGQPFILSFWSVTCEPCRAEMHVWKAMRRKHPRLPVLLVATDGTGQRAAIAKMLAAHDPGPVQHWAFADDFVERVRYSVDPKWRGELPRTYLFDATHKAEAKSGVMEAGDVEAWIARLAATGR